MSLKNQNLEHNPGATMTSNLNGQHTSNIRDQTHPMAAAEKAQTPPNPRKARRHPHLGHAPQPRTNAASQLLKGQLCRTRQNTQSVPDGHTQNATKGALTQANFKISSFQTFVHPKTATHHRTHSIGSQTKNQRHPNHKSCQPTRRTSFRPR